MNLFLRRIPANTHHREIADFIKPALQRGWLRKSGQILNIDVLVLHDVRSEVIEYHGLVKLDSDWAVNKAVDELKNRRLNGRFVLVRPYFHRNWDNDPRQGQSKLDSDLFMERRKADRRRGNYLKMIKNVSDHFNTHNDFLKSLNHQIFQIHLMVLPEIELAVLDCLAEFQRQLEAESGDQRQLKLIVQKLLVDSSSNERNIRSIQFHGSRFVITAFLERLKHQFSGQNITYWVTPVVEFGCI